jgi:hypothetical protein
MAEFRFSLMSVSQKLIFIDTTELRCMICYIAVGVLTTCVSPEWLPWHLVSICTSWCVVPVAPQGGIHPLVCGSRGTSVGYILWCGSHGTSVYPLVWFPRRLSGVYPLVWFPRRLSGVYPLVVVACYIGCAIQVSVSSWSEDLVLSL